MTKLDVLNIFESIEAATEYEHRDGTINKDLPFDLCDDSVKPVYTKYEGWNASLDGITSFDALPEKAKSYVLALEEWFGVPIKMVSTGPEREKLIIR